MSNAFAPLIAEAARHVDISDQAGTHLFHCFPDRCARAALAAVLANHFVLFDCLDQLTAFPPIVRAWLLDVDVFARLRSPDAHQRVPVIRSCDGNRVYVLVFQ